MRFPVGFLFGAATSATQIEGGVEATDWAAWTREKGLDSPGGDSWDRWGDDVALLRELGLGAYRLSLEWARLETEPGRWDRAAWDGYRRRIGMLVDAGITPMITLHHFTLPRWLALRGGLTAPDLAGRLADYAGEAARVLGDLCRLWVTINEPNVVVAQGYLLGVWPPGERRVDLAVRAHQNLLRAHVAMYRRLHEILPEAQVGLAHHLRVVEPARQSSFADRAGAWLLRALWNDAFAAAVSDGWGRAGRFLGVDDARGTQDFFGLNYYSRDVVRFSVAHREELFLHRGVPSGAETSDLGWEIYPEGLEWLISEWAARSGKPVYVTENGIADAADTKRGKFITDHLAQVGRALDDGVDVRGYFHWSLLDNFEWAEGYRPKFGLADAQRRPRESARVYARIARGA